MEKITIGLIREGKTPPDRRVSLPPEHCSRLLKKYGNLAICVQPSPHRCFTEDEYRSAGVEVSDNLGRCDILMGVKEVPVEELMPGKTYLFFSHTIKKQPYNRKLLKTILEKNIRLVEYECLTGTDGFRIIGFGRYAGIVGCYNGLYAYGKKYGLYDLKRAYQCEDRMEMEAELDKVALPGTKVLVTGKGRVGKGATEILKALALREVPAGEFITEQFEEPVYCQVDADEYRQHKDGKPFDFGHFFEHPGEYESTFLRFTKAAGLYIACHFWNANAPVFFTKEDMLSPGFNIKVVADISCDISGPIASTVRASTIEKPLYGYNPETGMEVDFDDERAVTVMAVDNLPCELPKDASADFGNALVEKVFPHLLGNDADCIIERATIAEDGKLTPGFKYLTDYVNG